MYKSKIWPIIAIVALVCVGSIESRAGSPPFTRNDIKSEVTRDSNIYDLYQLMGKYDRKPEVYTCSESDNFIVRKNSLLQCLSASISKPISKVNIVGKMNGSILGYDRLARTKSTYSVVLSEYGRVEEISDVSHCLGSVNENDIISVLKQIEWKPGIKNNEAVRTQFVVELVFDEMILIDENWLYWQGNMYEHLRFMRNELIQAYRHKGGIWDLEIEGPLLLLDNEAKLIEIIDIVEVEANRFIHSKDDYVNKLSYQEKNLQKDELNNLGKEMEQTLYQLYDKMLKDRLKGVE